MQFLIVQNVKNKTFHLLQTLFMKIVSLRKNTKIYYFIYKTINNNFTFYFLIIINN